jgi:GR25 family glycosyltransferase involved in LPS biosynthesis
MKVEAIIIHLSRAEGRWPQVERLQQQLPMTVTVLDAVDGQALADDEVRAVYRRRLHRPRYPFEMRRSEVACFLSHRAAWQMILDRGLDAGLIVEDDVELDKAGFRPVLKLAISHMLKSNAIRFPKKAWGETGPVVAEAGDTRIVAPRHVRLGMQAQLVGCDAARAFLAFTETFDRPVDTMLQMDWLHQVRMLSAMPVAIREVAAELGGTTVQKKAKSLTEILSRELLRARYRFAVRMHRAATSRYS